MAGTYQPGAVLSQVQLARMLGVSRTPLREAMRRLEEEGLIEAHQNQRARVASIGAESFDVMFTDRLLLEATGVKVTVPYLTEVDLNSLLVATTSFRVAHERGDTDAQDRARTRLHAAFVSRAGARLRSAIEEQFVACERHRRLYVALDAGVVGEYIAIAGACVARDAATASRHVARLEVRLAREVLHQIDPEYVPIAIVTALQMIEGSGAPP
jgi:DNA-binding GntR family transcriptional regulator